MLDAFFLIAIALGLVGLAVAFGRQPGGLSTPEQDEDDMQAQAEYLEKWSREHA